TKDLCVWIFLAGKIEYFLFDGFRHPAFTVCRGNDETAVCHVFTVTPGFNITESYPLTLFCQGNNSLAFVDFCFDVFGASLGYPCTARLSRSFHLISDDG